MIKPPAPNIPGIPPPTVFLALDGLGPSVGVVGQTQSVTRDEFFKTVVMMYHGQEFTVRDVILFEANIAGGVHIGDPRNKAEEKLAILNSWVKSAEGRITLRQLKSIARVVLVALKPLRDQVEKQRK
jgi:hypothetical protein